MFSCFPRTIYFAKRCIHLLCGGSIARIFLAHLVLLSLPPQEANAREARTYVAGSDSKLVSLESISGPVTQLAEAPALKLLSLQASPGFSFAFVGGGSPLTATATYDDGATHPTELTWKSADPSIARVDENGNYLGLKAGSTTITASAGEVTSNAISIYIADPPTTSTEPVLSAARLLSLQVSPGFSFAFVGGGSPLTATPTYDDGKTRPTALVWRSTDPSIARVDVNGSYVGLKAGTTSITASASGITSAGAIIFVADPPAPPAQPAPQAARLLSLQVSPGFSFAFVGGGSPLTATATYDDGTTHATELTWKSADPSIARVDGNGNYLGLKAGSTTITASAGEVTSNAISISIADSAPTVHPAPSTATLPPGHSFTVPRENACNSLYDRYIMSEPGVYAYWGLCEGTSDDLGIDYLGAWPLANGFGSTPVVTPLLSGPVADGEGAAIVNDARGLLGNQGFVINKNAGTLSAWINADATAYPVGAVAFTAVGGASSLALKVMRTDSLCFVAEVITAANSSYQARQCGYSASSWHRVTFTWSNGVAALYVDGSFQTSVEYKGVLDDRIFFERLFPGCCSTGKAMSLAKVSVANQAWTPQQVAADYAPPLIIPPMGGVYITDDRMGTIHRDVMGYVDHNVDFRDASQVSALLNGLKQTGVTSVRYAGGFAGYDADAGDWQNGFFQCSEDGQPVAAQNQKTENNLDRFVTTLAQPLNLSLGYTVNYGTNPPGCTSGGDPIINGANLVRYANVAKGYGIKYFEIGNEAGAYGGHSLDLHTNPYKQTGSSPTTYTNYEPAFYAAMKAVDPTIRIGVPVVGISPSYNAMVNYEFPVLTGAKFDAAVLHTYPVQDPPTDGATLYQDRVAAGTSIRGLLESLQTQLLNVGKAADAIWVTEWGSEIAGAEWSRQTMGAAIPLFVVTQLSEFMQVGTPYATYWVQDANSECSRYNFNQNGGAAYNWADGCGNPALVYTGKYDDGEEKIGLNLGDITPAARGFEILSKSGFVVEGEHMLRTVSDSGAAPWLLSYAASHGQGQAVILINRDRDVVHTVPVQLKGRSGGASVEQWTYGRAQYDESSNGNWSSSPTHTVLPAWTNRFDATLPPWSVNVLLFQ